MKDAKGIASFETVSVNILTVEVRKDAEKRDMNKRLAAFLGGILLYVCAATAAAQAPAIMSLGYSGSGISTDLRRVIEKTKLWSKRGLDVRPVYFNSGTTLTQAMLGGHVIASDSDVPAQLNLKVSGVMDVSIVAVTINRLEHFFVVRSNIKSAEDLKGKKVAISRFGSASDVTTRMVVRFWKLDPDKDLVFLQSGNTPTRIAALVSGQIDGALVSPDSLHKVLASNCCRVFADLSEIPLDYARFGIVMPAAYIKSQRDTARKFLEAYIEGIHVFKTRPEVALEALKEDGLTDPQVAKWVYDRIAKSLREVPTPEPKGIQAAIDSIGTPKARSAQAKDFIDSSLLDEIQKSGYIAKLYGK
jgi:ABC-type nitrate/sulfonate/bicarbonate transport system substrate-binding protein